MVPIALATGDDAISIREEIPHALIADVTLSGTSGAVMYDGVFSDTVRTGLFHALIGKKRPKTVSGTVDAHKSRGLQRRVQEMPAQPASRVLSAEQSNTSILYEDSLFLKLFRKLESGINPDVELTRYLTEQQNLSTVPAYRGSLTYAGSDDDRAAAGLLIDFVPNQGDAWEYTRDSIERFFATILVETDSPDSLGKIPQSLLEVDPQKIPDRFLERVDGFFLEMIELLGQRTGELHQALATQTTDPAFAPEPFSRLYQRSLYQSLRSLTRRVTATMKKARSQVPAEIASAVETFLTREPEILERFQQITARKIDAKKIRIHGDYHLGQVLFTGRDFVIIDLEGEPARTLSERRLKFSAFRDVAGMLRSFHYAISSRYLETIAIRPEDEERLAAWVRPWYTLVGGTFLHGYLETVAGASFVPNDTEAIATALEVFLLEKAVYEVGYEIDNRPDWLRIPLDGIEFVLDAGGVRG